MTAFLSLGYAMISWPRFAIVVLLGYCRHHVHLHRFTLALLLTLLVVTAISAPVPAVGAYRQLGIGPADHPHIDPLGYLDTLRDLPRVRDGSLRVLDLMRLVGIIAFPSFHAAAAVLCLWAFWPIWWIRPAAVIVDGAMLFATPIGGGHYFVDVAAGLAIAVGAIAAATWPVRRMAAHAAPSPAFDAAPPRSVGSRPSLRDRRILRSPAANSLVSQSALSSPRCAVRIG